MIGTRGLCAASFSAWLVLRRAGLRCSETVVPLRRPDTARRLRELSPTGGVPALLLDGLPIIGPMGIADHAAWRLPSLWPDPELRELARRSALTAVNGFAELAAFLPLDMAATFSPPGPLVRPIADGLARLTAIWDECREASGGQGKFLFGRFGVVDAMMAPWAARLATYAIPLEPRHADYASALQALPEWAEWQAAAKLDAAGVEPRRQAEAPPAVRSQPAVEPLVEPEPVVEIEAARVEPGEIEPGEIETFEIEPDPADRPAEAAPLPPAAEPVTAQPAKPQSARAAQAAATLPQADHAAASPPWNGHRPLRRPGYVETPAPAAPAPRRRPIRPAAPPLPIPERSTNVRAAMALAAVALVGTAAVLALPQALATIQLVAPYLRDVVVQPIAGQPAQPLPLALKAPEPTEAETALHPRVVVHYSGSERDAAAARRLARQLEDKGYVVALRSVDVRIARPSVRYYFADDRAATVELAASVEQSLDGNANPRVLDLSHQRSKPKPGTLEVWIGPTRS